MDNITINEALETLKYTYKKCTVIVISGLLV